MDVGEDNMNKTPKTNVVAAAIVTNSTIEGGFVEEIGQAIPSSTAARITEADTLTARSEVLAASCIVTNSTTKKRKVKILS
jgi:hypothetical protein